MDTRFANVFFLRATDPATCSIALEARFEVKDRSELRSLLKMPDEELGDDSISYDLDSSCVRTIVGHYRLNFEPGSMPVTLEAWHPLDEYPYKIHTRRELALMLAGVKPLAAFNEFYPCPHGEGHPEQQFAPHVVSGLITKREYMEPPLPDAPVIDGQRVGSRRVLYALRGEEWRIEALLLLWRSAKGSGWNEGFERMEGSLLGYEDWQNEYHIRTLRARGIKDARPPPRFR